MHVHSIARAKRLPLSNMPKHRVECVRSALENALPQGCVGPLIDVRDRHEKFEERCGINVFDAVPCNGAELKVCWEVSSCGDGRHRFMQGVRQRGM